ncbi:MAG: fumarylacetoacetate hydrolase family protein [Gammaproteobacteria bacterium]|nr:fumarylacetoacetate hydrolase family protein [Gammaproteobacteria bacterium]NND54683.1 fumarylacetoacetate hydrolase family protein [Gammaproteobacteria bacterium]
MRIASIQLEGRPVYGRVDGDQIVVADAGLLARYPSLADLLAADAVAEMGVADGFKIPVADASFNPVIPLPGKIICVGINYRAHMKEMGHGEPDYPVLFTRFPDTMVGSGQPLVRPRNSDNYDYEGELALVIGRTAHHVAAADALSHVAGYTCLMDGSLRDYQKHGSQFTPGKNFHRSGAMGPWLVTSDEIRDPTALNLETRLNGEVMQSAPVSDLKFDIPYLIEYISGFSKLEPGDVISTGTPAGVGFARDPQVWLTPGDTLEVEIDGIGVLVNPVAAED